MSLKAIIFDLGGVLVRTEDTEPRTTLGLRYGKSYTEMDEIVFGSESSKRASLGKISEDEHMRLVLRSLNIPETDEEVSKFHAAFFGGDRVDENLIHQIRALRADYTTAILSNAWDGMRGYVEDRWQIADAFDEVFISAELGIAKPHPKIYKVVLDKLACAPQEAVFVDDFIENVEAARKLGMHGIHFQEPEQAMSELRALF